MSLGWDHPSRWPLEDDENCPQQDKMYVHYNIQNTTYFLFPTSIFDDFYLILCVAMNVGIFVISFAEHTAYPREVALTQPDIWYYRQKIAIDVYARQWEMTDVEEDEISLETNV